jgi:hypothetical protein
MQKLRLFHSTPKHLQIGLLGLAMLLGSALGLQAQFYHITYSEGIDPQFGTGAPVVNEIRGGSLGDANNAWTASQIIPFNFSFYGQPVTSYRVSDNGYIQFDLAMAPSSSDPNNQVSLPNASAPTNAIFAYWEDFELVPSDPGTDDLIHNYTVGDPGSQVHVIAWRSVGRVGLPGADNFFYFAIRLYESGPVEFDVVIQWTRTQQMGLISATLGCQNASGTDATVFPGSPNLDLEATGSSATAQVYSFKTGVRASNDVLLQPRFRLPITMDQNETTNVTGRIFNHGSNAIQNLSIGYSVNGGATQLYTASPANPILTNEKYEFTHSIPFTATDLGTNDVKLWIESINNAAPPVQDTLQEDPYVGTGAFANRKKVLLEEFSTAPCQFCPDAAVVIENIKTQFGDNVVIGQHHAGFGTDAMTIPAHQAYAALMTTGAPTAGIDRFLSAQNPNNRIAWGRGSWINEITNASQEAAPADLEIQTYFDPATRQITAEVTVDVAAGLRPDTRLTVWVIEDSVIGMGQGYDQVNFYNTQAGHPYFGAGDPIVGYPHRDVVREVLTGTWGDPLPMEPAPGATMTQTFTYTLPATFDEEKIKIAALLNHFVEDPDDLFQYTSEFNVLNSNEQQLNLFGVGIEDEFVAQGFAAHVLPNPARGTTTVRFEMGESAQLKIDLIDMMGKQINGLSQGTFAAGQHEVNFNADKLANGLYFVRFQSTKGVKMHKFVVSN